MDFLRVSKSLLAWAATVGLMSGAVLAQSQQEPDFSKPKSHLPNFIAPYTAHEVPPPNFLNTPRLDQMIKDGKLMLSLDDAIVLALENNLDLAIARYNLPIADTDILRAKAGSVTRGVSAGIVQNTPGGSGTGVSGGTGTGGTTGGAGGAGAGAAGLVTSTAGVGSSIPSYDPSLTASLSIERTTVPLSQTFLTGTNLLTQNTGTANFTYSQGFATGTNLTVGFSNNRQASSNLRNVINPVLNSSVRLTVTQHLLQGLSLNSNRRFIVTARNNREIADVAFRLQVITTVNQIQNIYWDLVNAYEDVKVKERSLALAQRLLEDNRKQVQIGTLAPIEVVRAESQAAASNQDLIVAQTNLQLQQLQMLNALSRSLTGSIAGAVEVIPTSTTSLPPVEPVVPTQDLIADALAHRADLVQTKIDLVNREINNKAARNALLPSLDLFAFYGTSALSGAISPEAASLPVCDETITFNCRPANLQTTGYFDGISSLFGGDFPDKGVGFTVNIPIRNRSAQADQVRALLEYRQAQTRYQQLQNQIRIEVRNAQFALQQNRARVEAAIAGRELAQQTLDAEQKKYALGASTSYDVLLTQRDLTQAETNLVQARTAYEKARVEMDRVTGLTLTHLGIDLGDAEKGVVTKMPSVPNIKPRADVEVQPQQTPPPQQ